jgi:hypothetical protein
MWQATAASLHSAVGTCLSTKYQLLYKCVAPDALSVSNCVVSHQAAAASLNAQDHCYLQGHCVPVVTAILQAAGQVHSRCYQGHRVAGAHSSTAAYNIYALTSPFLLFCLIHALFC